MIRAIGRVVDCVDAFLEDTLHRAFAPAGPGMPREVYDGPWSDDRDEPRRARRGHGRPGHEDRERERVREELRGATAQLLFLRNKLEAEQTERRVRMARACHAILRSVREGDDETALPLLTWRRELREEIERAEQVLAGVRNQAADAKRTLAALGRAR